MTRPRQRDKHASIGLTVVQVKTSDAAERLSRALRMVFQSAPGEGTVDEGKATSTIEKTDDANSE